MAKSTASKKSEKIEKKTPAAFSTTEVGRLKPAEDNDSKYQPTAQANMNVQSLDAEDGLRKLFEDSIKDLYWAENHLVKALPRMINASSSQSLKKAISTHLEQTKIHVVRLEQVFQLLGKKPQAKKCEAMEGLTKEGEGVIEDTDPGTPARDLGIIMASQKVEHYEISAYMGLGKLAEKIGLGKAAGILAQTLTEEQQSDDILANIAENDIKIRNVKGK